MKKTLFISILLLLTYTLQSCKASYSFTGGNVGNAKTINIPFFPNNASFVEPTLSQSFQIALQDKFLQ